MRRIVMMLSILVVVGLFGFLPAAYALTTLTLSDGTTTITIQDGSSLDANGAQNAVTYIGSFGVWTLNVATGIRDGNALDLNSVDTSSGSGHLTITLSDDYYQAINGFNFAVGGTTAGTVTFAAAENNTPFATLGPYNTPDFSGNTSGNLALSGSYRLNIVADIWHPNGGTTCFDANLTTVPLPGALLLLGAGLARLATYARRREHV